MTSASATTRRLRFMTRDTKQNHQGGDFASITRKGGDRPGDDLISNEARAATLLHRSKWGDERAGFRGVLEYGLQPNIASQKFYRRPMISRLEDGPVSGPARLTTNDASAAYLFCRNG